MSADPGGKEPARARLMKAVRVHRFGGIDAIDYEEVPRPAPGKGQVTVRVKAAGVGPWDAWVRAGKSSLPQPLPLILGSDLAGVVEDVGPGVSGFQPGGEVLPLAEARLAHEMLAGRPHRRGKIVLMVKA